ncbi:MAG: 1,4-alpha-glucan branching protein GlgB [Nitrospirae bacterium]|nr:1,4-alpha-glucan branching protein GlgB [Nitrospirota bacterium]
MARGVVTISEDAESIIRAEHHDPFSYLGMHPVEVEGRKVVIVRAFIPEVETAVVMDLERRGVTSPMEKIHPEGLFEGVIEDREKVFPYRFKVTDSFGNVSEFHDPYSFLPIMSQYDLHLFAEGKNYFVYQKMGVHPMSVNNIRGVYFAVWAPNARRVSLVGDFNGWDGRRHPMRVLGGSGVWELFIPGLSEGEVYKYELKTTDGLVLLKSDPYGYLYEMRPKSASIVYNLEHYQWSDTKWMSDRQGKDPLHSPVSIYEVHLGSWRRSPEEGSRFLSYRELAHELVDYVKEMGFTHIELLPVAEHPFDASWGYQVTGYFAPTSRHGEPEDFMYLVDHCHQNGIGVILDWVPGHFPRDAHGLSWFDGTALYEHLDPRKGEHKEWGTLIFNYGRNEVRNFLLSNALFWFEKYHIDGVRVDAVASMLYLDYSRQEGEWVPNKYGGRENLEAIDFIREFNELVYQYFPGIMTIAEESTAWPSVSRPTYLGGLGFGLKWNMGWMHDTLEYISKDPVHRKYHQGNLTFSLLYAFHENFVLPLSHDEVVHGKRALLDKMPGDFWQRFSNLRALYGYMYGHPGKKLLFMGGEIGQWIEWNHAESLDWHLLQYEPHQKLQSFVKDLNALYKREPSLYEIDFDYTGFEWIDFHDSDNCILSFLRRGRTYDDLLIFVCNFTPVPRYPYRIGVPKDGFYRELMNSDSEIYGGGNMGNSGGVCAEPTPWQGRPYSIELVVPPLSVLILKPE